MCLMLIIIITMTVITMSIKITIVLLILIMIVIMIIAVKKDISQIICSSKVAVFLELRCWKTVHFAEETISADKYPSYFCAK